MYVSGGLGEVLPRESYAGRDAPAAGTVAQVESNWEAFKRGDYQGANFELFQRAVALGWVPDTPQGYDTFMWWYTGSINVALDKVPEFAGWTLAHIGAIGVATGQQTPENWVQTANWAFLNAPVPDANKQVAVAAFNKYWPDALAYYTKMYGAPAPAPGPVPTATAPEEYVTHPVTGQNVPKSSVKYWGPHPDKPGIIVFELTGGGRWEYKGPDYVEPVTELRDETTVEFVVSPPLPGGGDVRDVLAVRYRTKMSDGSYRTGPWERYAAQLSVAALMNAFPGSPWTVKVLEWSQLPASTQASIMADLSPTGWTPGPDGYIRQSGDDGTTPIPENPGGVTFVPPPGSADPITVVKPTGEIEVIPTRTSTSTVPAVTPAQVPEILSRVPQSPTASTTGAVVPLGGVVGGKGLALVAAGLVGLLLLTGRRR